MIGKWDSVPQGPPLGRIKVQTSYSRIYYHICKMMRVYHHICKMYRGYIAMNIVEKVKTRPATL